VLIHRNTRFERDFRGFDSGPGNLLRGTATLAKAGKDLGHMLGLDYQNYGVPRSDGILDRLDGTFVLTSLEFIANYCQFPLPHVFGEFGNQEFAPACLEYYHARANPAVKALSQVQSGHETVRHRWGKSRAAAIPIPPLAPFDG
jgi:hypothetical protein